MSGITITIGYIQLQQDINTRITLALGHLESISSPTSSYLKPLLLAPTG